MTDGQYLYHIVQYYSWMQWCNYSQSRERLNSTSAANHAGFITLLVQYIPKNL